MDYFTLFGLPARYDVDGSLLAVRFQDLQRQFHPDRFATAPERDRLLAMQQATTINDAYQTLKHPLKRAEYLLSLHGFDINNEQQTLRDTAFLMEQMTLREELEALEQRADADEALMNFADGIAKMVQARSAQMVSELDRQAWTQAADSVRKLRFLDRLQQQTEQLEERLLGM
ncbi:MULTISPECIES: co-chaperone HscB [Edwardsiella]|uniref:Co-chaperone protein HscB n=2 Tax=Edwardsiella anguillarum TaxID=1821960 RepID=A0A076LL73_9GAMM|nr:MULTISPECIES: co-chaperone HscB [Edwardsiella]AKM46994.1 co-chaperone HscB [Edwardsiella sp. EA181011]GAJ67241.1 chaperone protein HscB [Edwardsiella piscicida]AIJ07497.1 Fe-S protein assembly co-chaperone HscB [Edwardsiella anguillarum ET080813]AKR78710.1 co-chaperone HscB [Edwardsiella sp. LADL05-105]KAB0589039.1 co-chaperone HscB [Edwardsiella anguillarum]